MMPGLCPGIFLSILPDLIGYPHKNSRPDWDGYFFVIPGWTGNLFYSQHLPQLRMYW